MNVRFGSIHLLPQMDSKKTESEQLKEAQAQNHWGGEIVSLPQAAIDLYSGRDRYVETDT